MATQSDPNQKKEISAEEMAERRKVTKWLLVAVAVWGLILAFGSYLSWDRAELAQQHQGMSDEIDVSTRVLKFFFPFLAVALFVGGWILALRKRNA